MNKKTKLTLAITSVLLIVVLAVTFVGAATVAELPMAIINYLVGITEEAPEGADVNEDGDINIFDALISLKQSWTDKSYASYISLDDDSYTLDFDKETFEYTVKIPEGHPAVPQITAKGVEGVTVEIQQAFIPSDSTSGKAYVVASNGKGTVSTYTITFEKTADAGFELQYDDRYTFKTVTQLAEGEAFTFTSSNPEIISVDASTGEMWAKQVSEEDVTITATCGETVETLLVTEVEKAHVNLFLMTGQSNGQGCYEAASNSKAPELMISVEDQHKEIPEIGVNGAVYSYDVYPRSSNPQVTANTLYDMNEVKKQGPTPALGKAFYELSGEKVVFLHTAYSGAPIQSWLDPETRPGYAGYYGSSAKRNFYDATQKAYADLMDILDANNYEVIRTCNFWWHGGTATTSTYDYDAMDYVSGKPKMTDQEYYDLYMMLHEDMIRDFGLDYDFMILNRIQAGACSAESKALYMHTDLVPIRAAQFALTNNNKDIIMVSTVGDIATPLMATDTENEGYGYVSTDNVHFNQIGHNATGEESGTNAFYALKSLFVETAVAEKVEIIDTNGRDRLTSEDTIELKVGSTYRIAGLAYPIYSEDITYSSSNEKVATINEFGVITAVADGYAMITATSDSGKTQSVEVYVYSVQKKDVVYRWDFNDLTSTGTANTLTLSELAEANYKLEGGMYKLSGATTYTRPDFELAKPITLNSESAWEIEWSGLFKGTSFLFGKYNSNSESTSAVGGRIYNGYGANFGTEASPKYLLRFIPDKGSETQLIFGTDKQGEYVAANKTLNTWKIAYTPDDNMLAIYLQKGSESEGFYWQLVDSKKAGTYEVTFDSLFGRPYNTGYLNFNGEMDYIQVKCVQEAVVQEKNYRWEFDGNLDTINGNNSLTLSAEAIAKGASSSSYTFTDDTDDADDKIYTTTTTSNRPDFLIDKPIRVSSEMDWTVEWRAQLNGYSVLLGQTPLPKDGVIDKTSQYGCIYLAYNVSSYNSLRIKTPTMSSSSNGLQIKYNDYLDYNTSMNTWKLEYKAGTKMLTLYFKGANGWETVGNVEMTIDFDFAFTNLFGRYSGGGQNFRGSIDYVDIYTKETIYQ